MVALQLTLQLSSNYNKNYSKPIYNKCTYKNIKMRCVDLLELETIELVIKYTNVQIDVYEIKYLLIKKEKCIIQYN